MMSLRKRTNNIFIVVVILFFEIPSVAGSVDDFYSHQIKNSIWDIERRLEQNPSRELKEELFRLRKKYLSELKYDIRKKAQAIVGSNGEEKSNLIDSLSLLKKEYRKHLRANIRFLEEHKDRTDDSISEQVKKLNKEFPDYNMLCVNKYIEYSTFLFGKKEDDQYSCYGRKIIRYEFSKDTSGLGSDARISNTSDTHITVHWWGDAFSKVKYRIKIWVHDTE